MKPRRGFVKAWRMLLMAVLPAALPAPAAADAARGAYLFAAAGCLGCHTDVRGGGAPLAGGRALATPYGTFFSPNITPDPRFGIGGWSLDDFVRAMREGRAPDGRRYYPVFPYPSFTGMTDADLADLKAWLDLQPAVARENRAHDVALPFRFRPLLAIWNLLFLEPGPFRPDTDHDAAWNRGAYLVRHLAHCGECHSPRNRLGAIDGTRELAGTRDGPEGGAVPNITPAADGIGGWSDADLDFLLAVGLLPDGDVTGAAMAEVVENTTSRLTEADRAAVIAYLRALPATPAPPRR